MNANALDRWLFRYPMPTVWVSFLTTLLVVFTLIVTVRSNETAVERHIDNTIAQTVKNVLDQQGVANAKAVKDLHAALDKAIAGYLQECKMLQAAGQQCPQLLIQLPPGE